VSVTFWAMVAITNQAPNYSAAANSKGVQYCHWLKTVLQKDYPENKE
ncbi:hypothetical protein IQ225_17025, partial [Synechocystis salina LEGE 06155]|nr:hypothetical protein [Synechocystis salina LEGE 06155]